MRKIKIIIVCSIILCLSFAFTACDGSLDNILDNLPDYPFSEDGKTEVNLFFAGIKGEEFNGKAQWHIEYNDGEEVQNMVYTMYSSVDEDNRKTLMEVEDEERHFAILSLDETDYFIDYDEKTVSVDSTNLLQGLSSSLMIAKYGVVEFEKEGGGDLWEFVEKRTATIENSEGQEIDTVEYEYSYLDEEDITMIINFRKTFFVIERLYYEIQDEDSTGDITIYVEITNEVNESKFEAPGDEEGYTFIDEE